MKQIITTISLFLVLGKGLLGQTLKNYSGNFNTTNFRGTSNYQYNEENEQRIFNGPFSFKSVNNSVLISGNYSANLKSGTWKFSLNNAAFSDIIMKYLITSNVTGNYLNGNLNGTWNLTRTKTISFANSGISEYYQSTLNGLSYLFDGRQVDFNKSSTVNESSVAKFKDNHFIGSFTYTVNGGKSKITGQFDENGYFDSTWTVNYYSDGILHQLVHKYKNGVLISIKEKDNSTGEITVKYDATIDVAEFFQNFNAEDNSSFSKDTYYKLTEQKSDDNNNKFLNDAISVWYNNTSISVGCYAYEIEKGSIKMTRYPERKITIDEERTEEYRNQLEARKEEQERKEQEDRDEKRRIQQAKEEQERKIKYEAEEKRRAFENSDFGQLRQKIKTEYSAWLEKKEFETESDFTNRIKFNSQTEFNKIVESETANSKKRMVNKVLSAALQEYDIDKQAFTVKLFEQYSSEYRTDTIYIYIPSNLAQNLKNGFAASKAEYGSPILVHILDVVMLNNRWTPSKIIFTFANQSGRNSGNYNSPYLDGYYWNKTFIESNGKGQYVLSYANNISLKPVKLKDIKSQFKQENLDEGVYFYEYLRQNTETTPINFTIENLGF